MNLNISWTDLRNFGILLGIFLVIDGLWLTVIAKQLYAKHLGYLMAEKPKLFAALVFYVLYAAGLYVFAVHPALGTASLQAALLKGALFGLIAYATYDLTNLATVKDWPVLITAIDLVWGTVLSASVSVLSYWVIRLF